MSKPATKTGPTLRDLMDASGVSPARVEVSSGVSCASVFRAMRGERVNETTLRGIATACARDLSDVKAAHARSKS